MSEETSAAAIKQIEQKVHPIVEFFAIDRNALGDGCSFLNEGRPDHRLLKKSLQTAKGIYSFYNSEYEIIYVGKTRNSLWSEMNNAFNRPMSHYERYKVSHPHGKYKPLPNGLARPIKRKSAHLYDAANFFSAYSMLDDTLIDVVEFMIIRMLPNDILNKRVEGNTSLKAFTV